MSEVEGSSSGITPAGRERVPDVSVPGVPGTVLIDGSLPMTAGALLEHLKEMEMEVVTTHHAPVCTVMEAKAVRGGLPGCHTKNLFVRNKKQRMWLVVCEQDRSVDLRALGEMLGAGRLSFGSPRRLMERLGVTPGSVNPFAVVNDVEGVVTVVLERCILDSNGPLNFHPLDNAMTTAIGPQDFLRFLEAEGHLPVLVDLGDGVL
jgi:Ala-tRNA(Pro) deacylase